MIVTLEGAHILCRAAGSISPFDRAAAALLSGLPELGLNRCRNTTTWRADTALRRDNGWWSAFGKRRGRGRNAKAGPPVQTLSSTRPS
jgi:hypothetical protein